MDQWDGPQLIDSLRLSKNKHVLEVGVGTGRLARKVCGDCNQFVGIDISPKTIERAKSNLSAFHNAQLICVDVLHFEFDHGFDVIYSSLTFMHIAQKQRAINNIAKLLNPGGRFVLSISNDESQVLDYGKRKIEIYPDSPEEIRTYLCHAGLKVVETFNPGFATIIVATHDESELQLGT